MNIGTSQDLLGQTLRQNPQLIKQMSNTSNECIYCVPWSVAVQQTTGRRMANLKCARKFLVGEGNFAALITYKKTTLFYNMFVLFVPNSS